MSCNYFSKCRGMFGESLADFVETRIHVLHELHRIFDPENSPGCFANVIWENGCNFLVWGGALSAHLTNCTLGCTPMWLAVCLHHQLDTARSAQRSWPLRAIADAFIR